jgi:hypothetical protein
MEAFRSAPAFAKFLLNARIVNAALATGMFSFAAVIGYLVLIKVAPIMNGQDAAPNRFLFAVGAAGVTALQIVVSLVIGPMFDTAFVKRFQATLASAGARGASDPARILAEGRLDEALSQWFSTHVVRMALIEAAGLLSLIATLLTASPIAAGSALVAWAVLILHFPTEARLLHWLERITRRVRDAF